MNLGFHSIYALNGYRRPSITNIYVLSTQIYVLACILCAGMRDFMLSGIIHYRTNKEGCSLLKCGPRENTMEPPL